MSYQLGFDLNDGIQFVLYLEKKNGNKKTGAASYQLSHHESTHQEDTRTLKERPALATCDEYESLTDYADLEIYGGGDFLSVARERSHTEMVLQKQSDISLSYIYKRMW